MKKNIILLLLLLFTLLLFSCEEKVSLHVHNYGNNEWSESSDGSKMINRCVVCGEEISITKCNEHNFSSWYDESRTENSVRVCSVCNYKEKCSHNWGSWSKVEELDGEGDKIVDPDINEEDLENLRKDPSPVVSVKKSVRQCSRCNREEVCLHDGSVSTLFLGEITNGKMKVTCSVCSLEISQEAVVSYALANKNENTPLQNVFTLKTVNNNGNNIVEISKKDGVTISPEVLRLPGGVGKISSNAFTQFTTLKRIYLPSSIVVIDDDTFKNLSSLEEIHIDGKRDSVDTEALKNFFDNTSLDNIRIIYDLDEV